MSLNFRFSLNISWTAYQQYYNGNAEHIRCVANSGQVLEVHARHFRHLLNEAGLRGEFLLELDQSHKFKRIERLS